MVPLFLAEPNSPACNAGEFGSAKKRLRKLEYPDLDEAMDKWYDKAINRRRVIDRKLDAIEYDYEYEEIDIKTAIEYLVAAWKEVTPRTIKNCCR